MKAMLKFLLLAALFLFVYILINFAFSYLVVSLPIISAALSLIAGGARLAYNVFDGLCTAATVAVCFFVADKLNAMRQLLVLGIVVIALNILLLAYNILLGDSSLIYRNILLIIAGAFLYTFSRREISR